VTAVAADGRLSDSMRGASRARLAEARRRARAERRARTGNGPRAKRGHSSPVWAAVPVGYQPARDLRYWLAAVTDAAYAAYRSDAAERRIELAWILAKHTDWRLCTSRCGWALLADRGCVSRRTVARFIAWLRAENLLGVVSTGRSGMTRPMALTTPAEGFPGVSPAGDSPSRHGRISDNEAAVYVLTEPIPAPRPYQPPDPGLLALDPRYQAGEIEMGPDGRAVDLVRHRGPLTTADLASPVDEVGTPNGSLPVTSQHAPARACTSCHRLLSAPLRGWNNATPSLPFTGEAPPTWHPTVTHGEARTEDTGKVPVLCPRCQATRWPRHVPARTKRDRLALCERLRHEAPVLTWIGSTRRLRWLLHDFLTTGWTAADVLHAIDTHPVDGGYPYAIAPPGTPGGLRNPAGWLIHRLRPWRAPEGAAVEPFSARHAAATAAKTAAREAAGSSLAVSPASAPTATYRAAREALRTHRPLRSGDAVPSDSRTEARPQDTAS
jgi:hypothetical protein